MRPTTRKNIPCPTCGVTEYHKTTSAGSPSWECAACCATTPRQVRTSKKAAARRAAIRNNPKISALFAEFDAITITEI